MMHGSTVTYRSVFWRREGGLVVRRVLRARNSAWRVPWVGGCVRWVVWDMCNGM